LYLKRLVVGGFEKVYELNRNFRNEGISFKHNPEFTMLEFYCAYMDVNGMMDFCEELMRQSVEKATGGNLSVIYQHREIRFDQFRRLSMKDSIAEYPNWEVYAKQGGPNFSREWLDNAQLIEKLARFVERVPDPFSPDEVKSIWSGIENSPDSADATSDVRQSSNLVTVFDETESYIFQPTFIIDYPKSISPLSKASPQNPQIAERFELFINGMEVANGFSELNDPREQYDRFVDQMNERDRGDDEAMVMDEDYIRALSYGMPPAAGIGIGIDRLVMLLTNKHSIRDVILFPHLRPEKRDGDTASDGE